jgi:NAD(P)H-hydrate epimerase
MRGDEGLSRWEMHWDEVAVFDANSASLGVDEHDLMKAAGEALAAEVAKSAGAGGILFLCGPGNNGGDGFVAACSDSLAGKEVSVLSSHDSSKTEVSSSARAMASEELAIHVWPEVPDGNWTLIVDCLLGAGGSGKGTELRPPVSEVAGWAISTGLPILSCDIPTGMGGPDSLHPVRTVTFHSPKMGMTESGCGEIVVSELPWPPGVRNCGVGDALRYPPVESEASKGDRGRLLVVGGGPYHGAPILSGTAAARSGCDLVHVAMPGEAANRSKWPSSLIPEELPDDKFLTPDSLGTLSEFIDSGRTPDAIVIGPGIGREAASMEVVRAAISISTSKSIPMVVDADAISALPEGEWPHGLIGVATPHPREAERWLSGTPPSKAIENCIGEDSAIVITGQEDELFGPEGRHCHATGGHPRMAVGGTGDLLAGTIGGLLAQGMKPWPAARLACAVLREAGSRAAEEKGPGLLAEDVPVHIAHTLSDWTGMNDAGE